MNSLNDVIQELEHRVLDFNYMINSEVNDERRVYAWKYARNELEVVLKRLAQLNNETKKDVLKKELRNKWTPISERLPTREEYINNDSRFIVTDGNRVYQSLFDIYEKRCFLDVMYGREVIDNRVIAWQPLPELYKEC